MSVFKRILIPIDGSPASIATLEQAVQFVRDQGARVKLLTIADESIADHVGGEMAWIEPEMLRDNLMSSARNSLKKALDTVQKLGLEAESELVESVDGHIDRAILEAANTWHADLLVITTHGRHGLERLLLGSTAETLVRRSNLPILVMPIPGDDIA